MADTPLPSFNGARFCPKTTAVGFHYEPGTASDVASPATFVSRTKGALSQMISSITDFDSCALISDPCNSHASSAFSRAFSSNDSLSTLTSSSSSSSDLLMSSAPISIPPRSYATNKAKIAELNAFRRARLYCKKLAEEKARLMEDGTIGYFD
eukprot:gene14244-20216_t